MVEPKGKRVAEHSNVLGRNDGSPRALYPKPPMLTSKATPLSLTNQTPALPSERTSLLQVLGDDLPIYGPKKPYRESVVPCVGSFSLPPKKEELPPQEIHTCVPSYAMGDMLVREAHGADLMGHFGIAKTFTNKSKVPPHGLRIPFSIPMHSLGEIFMNLLVGLARRSTEIMGLDRTSRMEPHHIFHKDDASHLASLLPKEEVRLQALPVSKTLPAVLHVIANKSLGTWDACLFHDECVYEPMCFSFKFSLLQAYDGVHPIPPLDLTSLLLSARGSLHRKRRAGVIIRVPKMARYNLEEITRQYRRRTLRRTHDQADHLDNQVGRDLRTSPLQEGEDDAIKGNIMPSESRGICEVKSNDIVMKEGLHVPKQPMTRLWSKRLQNVTKDASEDVHYKKLGPPPWFHSNLHEQPMGRRLNTRKNSRKDNKDQTRQATTTADGRQDELTLKDDNLQKTFLQKESLSTKRHANSMPRSDRSFKVSKKTNNNDRHFKSRGKYNMNPVFKVTNLLSFSADELDLRSNPLQEGEDDVILTKDQRHKEHLGKQGHEREATTKGQGTRGSETKEMHMDQLADEDALVMSEGPMTCSKTKKLNGAIKKLLEVMRNQGGDDGRDLASWNQNALGSKPPGLRQGWIYRDVLTSMQALPRSS